MDKNKEELIELILDRLTLLDEFERKIIDVFDIETFRKCSVIDHVSDIGFLGIPMILEIDSSDFLNDLLYACITKKITKQQYFKSLNKYLYEEEK